MSNLFGILFYGIIVGLVLLAGPWCFIWAINTLIASSMSAAPAGAYVPQIVFGFWTWTAAAVIGGFSILPTLRRS